jgi:hypothetical protein
MRFLLSLGAKRRKFAPPIAPIGTAPLVLVHDEPHPALRAQREADGADLRSALRAQGFYPSLVTTLAGRFYPGVEHEMDRLIAEALEIERWGGMAAIRFDRGESGGVIGVQLHRVARGS